MSEIDRPAAAGAWPFPRRLVALFTQPRALFEHLAERPSWVLPFLLAVPLASAAFVLLTWDKAWVPFMTAQFDAKPDTPEEAYNMLGDNGKMMYSIIIPVFGTVFTLIWAAIVQGAGQFILGGKLGYRQALSIVSHAGLVSLVALPIKVLLANAAENPQVTLGPGALLPMAAQEGFVMKFAAGFLQAFDVFAIAQTALAALGVSVVARVGLSKSMTVMFVLFVVFSLIGALIGAVTGG